MTADQGGKGGWVYAPSLDYAYEDRRIPLASYGDRRWWGNWLPPPRAGWQPGPMAWPDWRSNPWQGPGFGPRLGPQRLNQQTHFPGGRGPGRGGGLGGHGGLGGQAVTGGMVGCCPVA